MGSRKEREKRRRLIILAIASMAAWFAEKVLSANDSKIIDIKTPTVHRSEPSM
jgi:hypothetical protein